MNIVFFLTIWYYNTIMTVLLIYESCLAHVKVSELFVTLLDPKNAKKIVATGLVQAKKMLLSKDIVIMWVCPRASMWLYWIVFLLIIVF